MVGNGLQSSFAPTAIARLEDIVRYIAADDPATASSFAMHLLDRAELLSEFQLGTPYRKRRMSGAAVRSLFYLLSRAPRKPLDRSMDFGIQLGWNRSFDYPVLVAP